MNAVDSGRLARTANGGTLFAAVALANAGYNVVTGIWPLVSIKSMQRVTGGKLEHWLVRTMGLLISSIGLVLGLAGARRAATPGIHLLGILAGSSLAAIDLYYGLRGRISRIYLADSVVQIAFILGWAVAWWRGRRAGGRPR